MNLLFCSMAFYSFLVGIGCAQTDSAPPPGAGDTLENFLAKPTARVTWSSEIGRIDSDQAHAVITAVAAEDPTQIPGELTGIRIDLASSAGNDQVYETEGRLDWLVRALDEISSLTPRLLHARAAGAHNSRCVGSAKFWNHDFSFSASQCVFPGWSGLVVQTRSNFQFTGVDASLFRAVIIHAREELKAR